MLASSAPCGDTGRRETEVRGVRSQYSQRGESEAGPHQRRSALVMLDADTHQQLQQLRADGQQTVIISPSAVSAGSDGSAKSAV